MQDREIKEEFKIGDLVSPKEDTFGIKEKCLWTSNEDETIRPWDNVKISSSDIGIIVGFMGNFWHTCMVVVAWGGDLGGQKLALSDNKLIKAAKKSKKDALKP